MKINLTPLLKIGKKILIDEAVKITSKKIEENYDQAAKPKKFQVRRMALHGGKKGIPVYLAGVLTKIILFHFPQYGLDPIAMTAIISGLIFAVINLLKKKFGLNFGGIL